MHVVYLNLSDGLLVLLISGLEEGLCLINEAAKTSILGVLRETGQESYSKCTSERLTQQNPPR